MRSCPRAPALASASVHAAAFVTLVCFASTLGAQEPAATPRRSLADGMLRQLVEVEGVTLPRFASGLEPGTGEGPLVLLRLSAEGEPRLLELPRGYGDHGEGAAPVPMDEEVAEEVEEGQPGQQPAPAPRPGRVVLRVERIEGEREAAVWHLHAGAGEGRTHAWPAAEQQGREELGAFLRGLRDAATQNAEGEAPATVLELELPPDVPAARALQLWDAARAAGFGGPLLAGRVTGAGAKDPAVERISTLAEELGWEVRRIGRQPICTGELLVMLEGDVSWGRVVDVYAACARAGIWDIAFVGADGPHRCKLPLPVPFDKALLK